MRASLKVTAGLAPAEMIANNLPLKPYEQVKAPLYFKIH